MADQSPTKAKKVFQSASRNETYHTCTQLYSTKYLWKLPDPSNDGAKRGNVCHDALELLVKPRHKRHVDAALKAKTCRVDTGLWKLIEAYAKREGVFDPDNLKLIDGFMLVAMANDMYGPPGTIELFSEQAFEIEVEEPDGRRYNVKGFIDKTSKVKDEWGVLVVCDDYKSSKAKFDGKKATFNTQSIIYQLVIKRLYPDIKRRRFRFLFLKFPKAPWQEQEPMSDDQLEGYEWHLTDMQERLESFTLENANDNLAAFDADNKWLCGREGTKKDGSPYWMCSARKPQDYWVAVDPDGAIAFGATTEKEVAAKLKPDQRAEPRFYPGCPAWYNAKGKKRSGVE